MRGSVECDRALTEPVFIENAKMLSDWMKSLTLPELKKLWACSDKLVADNAEQLKYMDLSRLTSPALLSYDGIQYTYMAPEVFQESEFDYVQAHVRILSGLYGVLKPFDAIVLYRLEMQAKAHVNGASNLYEFWGDSLYQEVCKGDGTIINLASTEYSKVIEKYLTPDDTFITCIFAEVRNVGDEQKLLQKGVYAKMARGSMLRYAAEIGATSPDDLKTFTSLGYAFDVAHSNNSTFVFVRPEGWTAS